ASNDRKTCLRGGRSGENGPRSCFCAANSRRRRCGGGTCPDEEGLRHGEAHQPPRTFARSSGAVLSELRNGRVLSLATHPVRTESRLQRSHRSGKPSTVGTHRVE